ncbi:centrosomal protein 43 isoform X6 [Amia ocellicauda]|uniref:centrosomal protein 43 isoform X6 n=1 Tax=Amia ocellicauda TaxID=2972642 RepID=UPI003464D7E2
MSAAEEDTELRDLLVQNLENSGVLNKIKAELRAAVFLALEEQEKIESKTPLVNESLKRCLNTKDGRLVASLITDYLQVFNLDFTLAVFHPEINTLNGLESREAVARELGITEPEGNKNTPLLLEIVKRGRHKEKGSSSSAEGDQTVHIPKELSPKQIAEARKKFEHYDKGIEESYCDTSMKNKSNIQLSSRGSKLSENSKEAPLVKSVRDLDVDVDVDEEEEEEGDSFFDDPLPKPQKTYGCLSKADKISESSFSENKMSNSHKEINWSLKEKSISGASFSQMKKNSSLNDLSAINSDTDDDVDDPFADNGNGYNPGGRRTNPGKPVTSLTSLSDAPPLKSGLGSLSGVPPLTDVFESTNGNCTDGGLKDLKTMNDKIGSLGLGDEDEEYDDDFNSTSHRSDKTKSEVSIGEEIEEVSIEGVDFNASDKLEDLTQDHSISQFSEAADYMEEVASVSQK